MVVDFVEAKYVHATVMSSHFDVAISGSVPLIHDFDDVYPTLAPIKTSRRGSESRMRLNLNTHVRVRPRNKPKRVPVRCGSHTQCREVDVGRRGVRPWRKQRKGARLGEGRLG